MILFIDASDFQAVRFGLINPKAKLKAVETKKELAHNESYKTAEFLDKFLKQNKTVPKDLTKIIVCSGPGSFTGIRVGVALAEAMGFALHIPVVAIKKSQIPKDLRKLSSIKGGKHLILNYGRKPNITKVKAR